MHLSLNSLMEFNFIEINDEQKQCETISIRYDDFYPKVAMDENPAGLIEHLRSSIKTMPKLWRINFNKCSSLRTELLYTFFNALSLSAIQEDSLSQIKEIGMETKHDYHVYFNWKFSKADQTIAVIHEDEDNNIEVYGFKVANLKLNWNGTGLNSKLTSLKSLILT